MMLRAAASIVVAAGLTSAAIAPTPPVVGDKVALQVVPFPLTDVRLLDGPFKQAQRLDAEYLLSLEPDRLLHTFRVKSAEEWKARGAATAAAAARRSDVARRTIDHVVVEDDAAEQAHALKSDNASDGFFEGRKTREARGGWFSYELQVAGDAPVAIVATYRGSEGRRRVFDVLVDGQKIATESLEYHPAEALDKEYRVPETITRGKDRVTMKFQARPDAIAGALIEVRTVR